MLMMEPSPTIWLLAQGPHGPIRLLRCTTDPWWLYGIREGLKKAKDEVQDRVDIVQLIRPHSRLGVLLEQGKATDACDIADEHAHAHLIAGQSSLEMQH